MFFHLGRPTQCLSSCSSVHWSFRKLPFKSLREKKKSVNRLGWTSSCWKHEKFQFFVASNLCASHLETEIFVSRTGDKPYWVSVSHCRLHCVFGNIIQYFFFNLYSRIVFTFEALGGKASSRQKILKAFEFMFFPCRSH